MINALHEYLKILNNTRYLTPDEVILGQQCIHNIRTQFQLINTFLNSLDPQSKPTEQILKALKEYLNMILENFGKLHELLAKVIDRSRLFTETKNSIN